MSIKKEIEARRLIRNGQPIAAIKVIRDHAKREVEKATKQVHELYKDDRAQTTTLRLRHELEVAETSLRTMRGSEQAIDANRRANAIISQQADEMKELSDLCADLRTQLQAAREWLRMVADNFGFSVATGGVQEGDRLIYAETEGVVLRPLNPCRFAVLELAGDVIATTAKLVTNDDGIDPEAFHLELTREEANLIKEVAEQVAACDAARTASAKEKP